MLIVCVLQHGKKVMRFAVEKGSKEVITLLLSRGANVDVKVEDSITPLHIAAKKGYMHIAKDLINHGACTHLVKSDMLVFVTKFDNPGEKICDLSTSLEFVLESQDGVTYKDGKLLPKELKNYNGESRNLFDVIKEIL